MTTPPAAPAKNLKANRTGLGRLHPVQIVLLSLAIFILSQFAAGLLMLLVVGLAERLPVTAGLADSSTVSQFLLILLIEVLAIGGVVWTVRRHGARLQDIGLVRPQTTDIVAPLIGFAAYFGLFVVLTAVIGSIVPGLDTGQRQDIGFDDANVLWRLVLVFLALVVLAPLAEEVLFRGLLFSGLRQRMGFVAATVITSLMFGAAHIFGNEEGASLLWIAGLDTLILSAVLCYLRERTGRIWAPVLLHAIKNSLAFMLLFVITECPSCGFGLLLLDVIF